MYSGGYRGQGGRGRYWGGGSTLGDQAPGAGPASVLEGPWSSRPCRELSKGLRAESISQAPLGPAEPHPDPQAALSGMWCLF